MPEQRRRRHLLLGHRVDVEEVLERRYRVEQRAPAAQDERQRLRSLDSKVSRFAEDAISTNERLLRPAPAFGTAGPRLPVGRALTAPAPRAALPTQSRPTHGASIRSDS